MFQYASLKGIARNRGFEYTIPPEDVFGQNDPLVKTSPLNIYNVFENISKNKIEVVRNPMLQERMHEFDEELFRSCPDNVDLFGYFQSPKYFNHIKDEIKNDFKFTNEVESLCNEMYESISGKKVVSLHIRRTDYTVNNNHPLQPMSYYENALKLFDKNVQILVFSDDPKWCQEQGLFVGDSEKVVAPSNWFADSCAGKSVKDMEFSDWTWL